MNIAIVGVPQVGKSTLFRLLTHVDSESGKGRPTVGTARVPDKRVELLSSLLKPRKTTFAQINLEDTPGLEAGRSGDFLAALHDIDALVAVVRAFSAAHVPTLRPDGVDPVAELAAIEEELVLTDWSLVETRLARLRKGSRGVVNHDELSLLERLAAELEQGVPLRNQGLTDEERVTLQGLAFFSDKPMIVVINADEEQIQTHAIPRRPELQEWCDRRDLPLIEVCAQLEAEIEELEEADRAAFLADLGLSETGLARLARAAYACLGYISFFTVGEDEVRAWTVRQGSTARQAAGKIHSDIQRGFIRAEVVDYETYAALRGAHLRENGALRLEGRDYVVQDGDIINFRFNV